MVKDIVILANSRKPGGYCVAGIDINTGEWIRPIGVSGSISACEECLNEGRNHSRCSFRQIEKLDVVEINFKNREPVLHQRENVIIRNKAWRKHRAFQVVNLDNFIDEPDSLWQLGSSSNHGNNDRVNDSCTYNNSLYLIEPDSFEIIVSNEGYQGAVKKCVRGGFHYNGDYYKLRITDVEYEAQLKKWRYGAYEDQNPQNIRLCISLALDSYYGHYYKLIAGLHYLY